MAALKVGIIEDDLIIARSIAEMLEESGYEAVGPARRFSEAMALIEEERPDLLLVDVQIIGALDGIAVAKTVREQFGTPFIFLTANSDYDTILRAKEVRPAAFLSKPVTQAQLFAAIEIALVNVAAMAQGRSAPKAAHDEVLFIKDGQSHRKVPVADIVLAESEQNYVALHLADGSRLTMRIPISELAARLDPARFLRVHRSYLVATGQVHMIEGSTLLLGKHTVPIGKNYREEVMRALGVRRCSGR